MRDGARRRCRALLTAALTAAGLLLLPPRAVWAECLPPALERAAPETSVVARVAPVRGSAAVYIDASVSMSGFVQTQRGPRYADFILRLPEALEEVSSATAFNLFGKTIVPLPVEKLTEALRPASYICQPGSKDAGQQLGCETRIDQVLQAIAASDPRTVSVMVTDLFLSREELNGSASGTIKQWLSKVLHTGKSIAILGVSAAFDGTVYDLPPTAVASTAVAKPKPGQKRANGSGSALSASYNHKGGERPFFIVMVGANDQLLRLQKFFQTHLLTGLAKSDYHFSLFTRSPARSAAGTTPLKAAASEELREEGALPGGPDWLPLLTIGKGQAPTITRQPLQELQMPFTPPLARFEARSALWRDAGGRCGARWQDVGQPTAPIVTAQADGGDLVLRFEREGLPALVPNRTYLMRLQVQVTGTRTADLATRWLRDWGFSEKQTETLVRSRPKFFPALNLGEFADGLEAIVSSNFEPAIVVDRIVAFRRGG